MSEARCCRSIDVVSCKCVAHTTPTHACTGHFEACALIIRCVSAHLKDEEIVAEPVCCRIHIRRGGVKQDTPVGEEVELVWPNIQTAVNEEQHCWRSGGPVGRGIHAGRGGGADSVAPAFLLSQHQHIISRQSLQSGKHLGLTKLNTRAEGYAQSGST